MTTAHPAFTFMVRAVVLVALCGLGSCGGGGGGGGSSNSNNNGGGSGNGNGDWTPGTFLDADRFAAQCAAPRSGIDPTTGQRYPDVQGTATDENNWLRSWSNDLYLWYNEIDDVNPAGYDTLDYFDLLKTFATTPSGNPKDKFHFWYPTDDWVALSQSGITAGYGALWVILADVPPRELVVAYTDPNSPATAPSAKLARGAEVLTVDGVDLVNANDQAGVDTLNRGLWPAQVGEHHVFTVRDPDGTQRSITMTSANVTSTPVQNVKTIADPMGPVGYMQFNDHIATAEQELIDAIEQLRDDGVTDLVLDMRYNGGGYLDIANELAYMIAGPGITDGRSFEELRFNDKHPATNPVTGAPLEPFPFHNEAQGFSAPFGDRLPTLNLSRVFVLTGPDTCSASESVMNGLLGVDVQVIQIGTRTCGKPYGFYPQDNCGTTYFTIEFQGVNAKGDGDYTDGFSPGEAPPGGDVMAGCFVEDDFTHGLGDPSEARLNVALGYRGGLGCTALHQSEDRSMIASVSRLAAIDGHARKSPWLQNRTLRR